VAFRRRRTVFFLEPARFLNRPLLSRGGIRRLRLAMV
jgi:hypothetical protein